MLDDQPLPDVGLPADRLADAPRGRAVRHRAVGAAPVRHPPVRDVLLRHDRAAQGDGARRRRHAARARQGAPPARRPRARGHALLPHHHRLDDVELAAVRPGRGRAHRALRRPGPGPGDACGSSSPSTASPCSAPAPRICSCARTPATGRPRPSTSPGCGPCSPPAPCCTTGSSTGSPTPSGPSPCSRSPAAPTSSAASSWAPPNCPSAAAAARPAASASTWPRSTRTAREVIGDGRRAGLPSTRSPPGPSASCATPTAPASTRSYFADHPGMWTHGDLIEFDPDGSARLHGRSDGVLNIDGVRIGPSEIYTVLRGVPEIADTMAVEQRDPDRPGGVPDGAARRPPARSPARRRPGPDHPADAAPGGIGGARARPWSSPCPSCRSRTTASVGAGRPRRGQRRPDRERAALRNPGVPRRDPRGGPGARRRPARREPADDEPALRDVARHLVRGPRRPRGRTRTTTSPTWAAPRARC